MKDTLTPHPSVAVESPELLCASQFSSHNTDSDYRYCTDDLRHL